VKAAYLASGGWVASAVGAAASFGLADLLADGPKSCGELAAAAGLSEPILLRTLRLLTAVGLFTEMPDGRFANSAESEWLKSDHPRSLRHFCRLASGDYQRLFLHLEDSLRTGTPATPKAFGGRTLYDYFERAPEAADTYERAMEDLSRAVGPALAAARDFSTVDTVVDVGGGRGGLLQALLRAHPHLTGICADRAGQCARASADLRAADPALAKRLAFAGCDFFEAVPDGGDLYLLKNVLHNWNDASAVKILHTIGRALQTRPHARLLVIESLVEGEMSVLYRALDDLLRVVACEPGAVTRREADLLRVVEESGLRVVALSRLPSGHGLLEASVS
jgi:C-methyltransferase